MYTKIINMKNLKSLTGTKKKKVNNTKLAFHPNVNEKHTHKTSGASLHTPFPPNISLAQTSLKNQHICATAHPSKSPRAARHVPFRSQEKATRVRGR